MKKININKKFSGSLTIEASYIFPIILALIAAFIILSFYMHDKIVSNSIAYRSLIYKNSDCISSLYNTESSKELTSFVRQSLLAFKHARVTFKDSNSCTVHYYGFYSDHIYSTYEPCQKTRMYFLLKHLND